MGTHPIFESDFDCLTEMEHFEVDADQAPSATQNGPPVQVEKFAGRKNWLGGFRHKISDKEFHNAETQTNRKIKISTAPRNCRETQTYFQRHKELQTAQDAATQMTKPGVHVSTKEDKIIIPGPYTMVDTIERRRQAAAIVIQKYFRRYLAIEIVKHLKIDKIRYEEWVASEKLRLEDEREKRKERNLEGRLNPRTERDFELVWAALESWRAEQIQQINETAKSAVEQKAALATLQEQVAQLVAAIGRHKTRAAEEAKEKKTQKFLDACAAPRRWKARDGKWVEMVNWTGEPGKFEMDTGYTLRAKELRDLYNTLKMDELNTEERIDALLSLKNIAAGVPDCKLTKEIISLCEREAELLMRGINPSLLSGLRARILHLFLQFCREPKFNPEAARHLKVPQDAEVLRGRVVKMNATSNYLSHWPLIAWPFAAPQDFELTAANKGKVERNPKPEVVDIKQIIKDLRNNESDSDTVFILSEGDIRHLVQNIWSLKSALSHSDEDLVLCRWRQSKAWSPWNCFLITKNELEAHNSLSSPEEGYGPVMFQKVHRKHLQARQYFSRIAGMAQHLREQFGTGINQQVTGTSIKQK